MSGSEVQITAEPVAPATAHLLAVLGLIPDPELPIVSVVDLGMIHRVGVATDGIHVTILPTFIGCPALDIIRYHSCYAVHQERAYPQLLGRRDAQLLQVVRDFNQYDLYSKSDVEPDEAALRPFYESLVAALLPDDLQW